MLSMCTTRRVRPSREGQQGEWTRRCEELLQANAGVRGRAVYGRVAGAEGRSRGRARVERRVHHQRRCAAR